MNTEKNFAEELNALITRHLDKGADPQAIADELARESNLVFGRYNLEIYLEVRPGK